MAEQKSGKTIDLEELSKLKDDPHELMKGIGEFLRLKVENFRPDNLEHSLRYLRGTVGVLKKDTDRCEGRYQEAIRAWLANTDDQGVYELLQFELRQLIRTFFSEVEGTIYVVRQVLLWAHERGDLELSVPEVALLREESYRFNRREKKAEARPSFASTLDSFVLVLALLPRMTSSGFDLDLSQHGWESFQKLLEIRNTITHPKQVRHLVVDTDIVIRDLPVARSWYYKSLVAAVGDPGLKKVIEGAA